MTGFMELEGIRKLPIYSGSQTLTYNHNVTFYICIICFEIHLPLRGQNGVRSVHQFHNSLLEGTPHMDDEHSNL